MAFPAPPHTHFLVKFQTYLKALIFGLNFLSNLATIAPVYATGLVVTAH